MPTSADRVFAFKFAEAVAISSWAFLLLGSPLMVAYGISVGVPWTFYVVFVGYLVAFVLIPGSVGAVAAIADRAVLPEAAEVRAGRARALRAWSAGSGPSPAPGGRPAMR